MVVYEIVLDFLQILNLLTANHADFQKEFRKINIQENYQPAKQNLVYGECFKAKKVDSTLNMDEAKIYCKNAFSNVYFVSPDNPNLKEIFDKFGFTEIWDSSYFSARYKMVLTEDGATLAQSSGNIRIELDPALSTITADKCIAIQKKDDKFWYIVADCTAKKSVVCITESSFPEQISTVSNLKTVQTETLELILIFNKVYENHFSRIKRLYKIKSLVKETEVEVAESVNLDQEMENQLVILKNLYTNFISTFKRVDHAFDIGLLQVDFLSTMRMVEEITKVLSFFKNCLFVLI